MRGRLARHAPWAPPDASWSAGTTLESLARAQTFSPSPTCVSKEVGPAHRRAPFGLLAGEPAAYRGAVNPPLDVPCVVRFARASVEVTVPAGQTLLDVAEAHGVAIDALCRGGTCGTCRARLVSGQPAIESEHGLRKGLRVAGWLLTCSARTVAGQRIVLDL